MKVNNRLLRRVSRTQFIAVSTATVVLGVLGGLVASASSTLPSASTPRPSTTAPQAKKTLPNPPGAELTAAGNNLNHIAPSCPSNESSCQANGIFSGTSAQLGNGSPISPQNYWVGTYQDQRVTLYAGQSRGKVGTAIVPGTGELYIVPMTGDASKVIVPNAPTWVKIDSVNGTLFILQRADGSTLTFDLATNTFSPG